MTRAPRPADPHPRPVAGDEAARILLVDQDDSRRGQVCAYLDQEGFRVLLASHADEAETLLERKPADLVVLQTRSSAAELGLCRRLSSQEGPPVILVSDGAGEVDRIVGLEVGADDFISQPCSLRELLARIRAVLRRQSRPGRPFPGAPAASPERTPVRFAGWTLCPWTLEVQSPEGERCVLTASDLKLLSALLQHPQKTITRERMADHLGLQPSSLRSLDTAVCRLRRKLGATSATRPLIRTVHGLGYMLTCPVDLEEHGAGPVEDRRSMAMG